jgi:hypothetical protein
MPAGLVDESSPRERRLWKEAKKQAADQGRAEDWKYVSGIFMRLRDRKGGKDPKTPSGELRKSGLRITTVPGMVKACEIRKAGKKGKDSACKACKAVKQCEEYMLKQDLAEYQKVTTVEYGRKSLLETDFAKIGPIYVKASTLAEVLKELKGRPKPKPAKVRIKKKAAKES